MRLSKWIPVIALALALAGCADATLEPSTNAPSTNAPSAPASSDGKADHLGEGGDAVSVHGWVEGSVAAERVLDVANGVGLGALYGTTGLDSVTAHRIDEYRRRFGSYETLGDLDRIWGVGAREFQLLWAWGERRDFSFDAPPRPAVEPDSLETVFDPNGCVGTAMTRDDALALLGDDERVVLGTTRWATEHQACYEDGHCTLSRIRDDARLYEGQLSLRKSHDLVIAEIQYFADGRETRAYDEMCIFGNDCPGWMLNNECVVFRERTFLSAASEGDWTHTTQGFYFALQDEVRVPPAPREGGAKTGDEPQMPLTGGMDPMSCTGPMLTDEDAERLLGSNESVVVGHGEIFYQSTPCDGAGDCEDAAPSSRGSATLELWRNPNGGFGVTMRAYGDGIPPRQSVASCGLGDERCGGYDWHVELRQSCARFNWNTGGVALGGEGSHVDWAANFSF